MQFPESCLRASCNPPLSTQEIADTLTMGVLELDASAAIGQNVREVLNLDDHVFTLKLTPNLAHALSVYGVARELSALTGAPLVEPKFAPVQPRTDAKLKVKVSAPDLCGRFS